MPNDSGQDLAELEYEFATKPTSEAFIPLAEAYLNMGRFVEAMVVCKKGIKAHPELPTGRLIMARIYSDQAKHQKAINELNNLLKMSPQHGEAFRMLGKISIKLGQQDEGVDYLKKAVDANPEDDEARAALHEVGIDYLPAGAEPEPEPEPQVQAPPVGQAVQAAYDFDDTIIDPRKKAPHAKAQPDLENRPTERAMPVVARQARPKARKRPKKKRIADLYQEMESEHAAPKKGNAFKMTAILGGVLAMALVIYIIYTWQAGLKQEEINKHLEAGRIQFNKDSYTGYKKALADYEAIIKLDKEQPEALSRASFITAVLVGEYGEAPELMTKGDKHMRTAVANGQDSTMLTSAQALHGLYGGGSTAEVVKMLERALKDNPESGMLNTTLGRVFLRQGKLGEAKEALMKGAGQGELRAFAGLGDYAIRRSLYMEANKFFSKGLQTDNQHVPSLLNAALVSLLWGESPVYTTDAAKKVQRFDANLSSTASDKEKAFANFLKAVIKVRVRKTRSIGTKELNAILKKESSNSMFHFVVARELRSQRKYKKALKKIKIAVRVDSSRPDFILEEAAIYLALGDYESARSRALRVQGMDVEGGRSSMLVGDAYFGEKNFTKAKEWYNKCREFSDTEAISHLKLAHVYLKQPKQDKDLAQSQLELAVPGLATVGERRKAAEASFTLAMIYAEKNRIKEFAAILKKAMAIDSGYAPPFGLMAGNISLESADGRKEAKELCKTYLDLTGGRGQYAANCLRIKKL
ncbi:MAG: tetratricopeptide repeat protein [Deltaproteobacteria bacterium]|nr:tetratricopeptide repeat protein [Deltaproteobacteria bacterium]